MTPENNPKRKPPRFKPSQLVLCRYETYPYWPAKVVNTFPSDVTEGFRCFLDTYEGTFPFYWCMFCNEEKGGWVREDRIILFHPTLVHYIRVPPNNLWYYEQKKALRAAFKFYNALYSKALPPKAPEPIPDLLIVHSRDGDPLNIENEDVSKTATNREEPKDEPTQEDIPTEAKGEPSFADSDSFNPNPSTSELKRKRKFPSQQGDGSERQNPTQIQRIESSPVTEARHSGEDHGEVAEVTFFAPPPPEDFPAALPEKSTYLSVPASAATFSEMIKNLRSRIDSYTEFSKDAEEAHHIFDHEKENIRRRYKNLFEKLRQVERRAEDEKQQLVALLQEILQARVDIGDLKKHRAGTIIKSLERECENVPAIQTFCEEITDVWASVVDAYVREVRESV